MMPSGDTTNRTSGSSSNGFLRVRLNAGIATYVLSSILSALGIPSVVIKIA